jgi:hypothetical protein
MFFVFDGDFTACFSTFKIRVCQIVNVDFILNIKQLICL